ncbi:hypothetical protein DFP72DRAFT_857344 [Ephemerocybe angulata]|uniref:Uncharacterized protein n=1 Tax=Ephemerocybe angulata TaxID=980116 RepID=A0A8H6HEU8_9AGAR|nr:hypothetical protein DFP72DRAFT_857344 [Tulosesus angulatus]
MGNTHGFNGSRGWRDGLVGRQSSSSSSVSSVRLRENARRPRSSELVKWVAAVHAIIVAVGVCAGGAITSSSPSVVVDVRPPAAQTGTTGALGGFGNSANTSTGVFGAKPTGGLGAFGGTPASSTSVFGGTAGTFGQPLDLGGWFCILSLCPWNNTPASLSLLV